MLKITGLSTLIFFSLLIAAQISHGYSPGAGPNVCGTFFGLTRCCDGWTKGLDGFCTIAICAGNCGDRGSCIAPNKCRCEDGSVRDDCSEEDEYGFLADEPVRCPSNCNNRGSCIGGRCICETGFRGSACDEEDLGPCFLQTERGVCRNVVKNSQNKTKMMTRTACCASVGAAWGDLCQVCGNFQSYCGRGYILLDHKCVDVNECEIPNVCTGGICRNTEGSFECDCPYGYVYDKVNLQCQPSLNGCQRNPDACKPGGRCIPLHGTAYFCQCNPGYVAADGNTKCRREEASLNYCEIFEGKLCKNGECHPTASSYECTCNPGYVPSRFKKQCIKEFNACIMFGNSVCLNGQCIPNGRSYRCQCNPGYALSNDGTMCLDKCQQLGPALCLNGFCVGRPYGDYECLCNYGYQSTADKKSCIKPNQLQATKREIWSGNSYRNAYQADWPQGVKFNTIFAPKPMLSELRLPVTSKLNYQNPCVDNSIKRKCAGGFCLNLGNGQYECRCFSGYRAVNGNTQCIPEKSRQNNNWPYRVQYRRT